MAATPNCGSAARFYAAFIGYPAGPPTENRMNKTLRNLGLALALCGASSLALAAPPHPHGHYEHHGHHDRGHYDHRGHAHHDRGRHNGWHHPQRWHHWERGHRYSGPVYVVRDYGHYRLRPPPRGYHWVRGDAGSYLLVAIATGVILDIAMH
jgi:Ni/Co efflux regulator RcnB